MDCANGDDSGYPTGQNPNVVEKYAKIRKTRVYAVENIVDNVDNWCEIPEINVRKLPNVRENEWS